MTQRPHPAGSGTPRRRGVALVGAVVLLLSAPVGPAVAPDLSVAERGAGLGSAEIARIVRSSGDPDLIDAYAARDFAPVWVVSDRFGAEAHRLVRILSGADEDGLDPDRYQAKSLRRTLQARHLDATALASADVEFTRAYTRYITDLRTPVLDAPFLVDAELAPRPPTYDELIGPRGRALDEAITQALVVHPVYAQLRQALARHRAGPVSSNDETRMDTERLILINLERARALPARPADRYAFVDVVVGKLELHDRGRSVGRMKVAVGRSTMPTPVMAGMIRHAIVNPYWNLPPDLARDRYAERAKAQPGVVEREGFEVLSDWTATAVPISSEQVDWSSVATGETLIRVRQKPGPENMMGRVKFMLPNKLGIYLHDTPERGVFGSDSRAVSAGCVRVEDADRLFQWLFGRKMETAGGSEASVDLARPVPVYILYLTADVEDGELRFRPDIYNRDAEAIQRLADLRP